MTTSDRIRATLRQRGPLPATALRELIGGQLVDLYAALVHLEALGVVRVRSTTAGTDWEAA